MRRVVVALAIIGSLTSRCASAATVDLKSATEVSPIAIHQSLQAYAGSPQGEMTTSSALTRRTLDLRSPLPSGNQGLPFGKSVKALINGDGKVTPWFPVQGAVGVRLKVTW